MRFFKVAAKIFSPWKIASDFISGEACGTICAVAQDDTKKANRRVAVAQ
jgi:hypothetical protein